jgi:hypothetical protein
VRALSSSLADAKSSLADAKNSLGDAKSLLGDAKSSLADALLSLTFSLAHLHAGLLCAAGQRFHRSSFAKGPINRVLDWLDWMLPEAWDVEHNNLHHYKLGETTGDPDLVERNVDIIRQQSTPRFFKYIQVRALGQARLVYDTLQNRLKWS